MLFNQLRKGLLSIIALLPMTIFSQNVRVSAGLNYTYGRGYVYSIKRSPLHPREAKPLFQTQNAGLAVRCHLGKYVTIAAEMHRSTHNADSRLERYGTLDNPNNGGYDSINMRVKYLLFPLTLEFQKPVGNFDFVLTGGFVLAHQFSEHSFTHTVRTVIVNSFYQAGPNYVYKNDNFLSPGTYGFNAGLGINYNFGDHFQFLLRGRYNWMEQQVRVDRMIGGRGKLVSEFGEYSLGCGYKF
jgi:hypothetical protein